MLDIFNAQLRSCSMLYFIFLHIWKKTNNDTLRVFDFENTEMVRVTEQIKTLDSV